MKLAIGATMAAMLAVAAPVWAHGGYGHANDRYQSYRAAPHGHFKQHHKRYYGYREHHRYYPGQARRYYYEPYAYPAYPAYRAPGVHLVLPDVVISF